MLNVIPVPAFSDNYIWLVQRNNHPQVVVVDPGQAQPVMDYLARHRLQPVAILITHQHYDHSGGVAQLLEHYPGTRVIGPGIEPSARKLNIDLPIPELITQPAAEGDRIPIAELELEVEVMAIPGHTLDHLAYRLADAVFCGDCLFAAGCGYLFSGTPQMMCDSLQKLAALPASTRLYCAHEYTLDNLGFARWVEPDNPDILQRDQNEMEKQEKGQPTLPSSVELECKTNPFIRVKQPQVRQAAEKYAGKALPQDWQVFAALREWKDKEYD